MSRGADIPDEAARLEGPGPTPRPAQRENSGNLLLLSPRSHHTVSKESKSGHKSRKPCVFPFQYCSYKVSSIISSPRICLFKTMLLYYTEQQLLPNTFLRVSKSPKLMVHLHGSCVSRYLPGEDSAVNLLWSFCPLAEPGHCPCGAGTPSLWMSHGNMPVENTSWSDTHVVFSRTATEPATKRVSTGCGPGPACRTRALIPVLLHQKSKPVTATSVTIQHDTSK